MIIDLQVIYFYSNLHCYNEKGYISSIIVIQQ